MLNALRKSVKTLPAKILIGFLVAGFALWGIGDIFNFRVKDRVAMVGDTEIPAQRLADSLAREQQRLTRDARQFISYDTMRAAGIDRRILGRLVRDAAFTEELNGLGISAPDESVAEAIHSTSAFQGPGGEFSLRAYQLYLAQIRMTPAEFESLNRTLLSQQILTETAEAGVEAPPGASARIAAYQGEQRLLTTIALTLDKAPDPGAPDEGALRTYYDDNPALFTEPERRWGEYIHVDNGKLAELLTPDEDRLKAAYEADKAAYSVPETREVDQVSFPDEAAAQKAIGRLVGGAATFEALGEEAGLTPETLSLGRVTPGDLPEAAADAVFTEKEPGIIGPVKLPAGYGIFRIREIHPGGTAPFEDVRNQIARRLTNDAVRARAPELANMVDDLRSEGLPLADIASRVQGEAEDGAAVVYGKIDGLARNATLAGDTAAEGVLADQAFIDETFSALDGEERDMVETASDGYLLVLVNRIEQSRLLPLEDVRDRAVAAWQDAERLKALEARAAEIAAGLSSETSIWTAGEELGTVVQPYGPFTRLNPPKALPPKLVERAFDAAIEAGVSAAGPDGKRVFVAQVSSVIPLDPERMAASSAQLDKALADALRADTVEYFARAIASRHPAYVDQAVVDQVFTRLGAVGSSGQ